MTDIAKIAAACANRIMDRMEMCRGSAILKSDIEREVEMALREEFNPLWPTVTDEGKQALADGLGSIMRRSPQATYDASADTEEDDEYSAHVKSHDDAFLDDFFGVSAPPVNNVEKCYVYHKDSALHVYDEDGGKAQERIDKMFRAYERTMGQLTEQSVNPPKVETVLLPAESTPDGDIAVRSVTRAVPTEEEIAGIGYINADQQHVQISIRNPTLTSEVPKPTCAQIVITAENARKLARELAIFMAGHNWNSEDAPA